MTSEPERPVDPAGSAKLITVGIPVYNGKSLLRSCLQSVLRSTLPRDRYEIVVADDHSTEPETLQILAEFERSLAGDPGFFRLIRLPSNSGGAARPRNKILEAATGAYVFFVDADDTIATLTLERVAAEVSDQPVDWIALNQVAVNGRLAVFTAGRPREEVSRDRALTTLTVHKVFRRAEIERQGLRFDERLPSGQDLAFAFSFIVHASTFLMLGGYDYYHLTLHRGNSSEPGHLSMRANQPPALIAKYERILTVMLAALSSSPLNADERRRIAGSLVLPRLLLHQGYLRAITRAEPEVGNPALKRLSALLADPLVTDVGADELTGVTPEHLRLIAAADRSGLRQLLDPREPESRLDGLIKRGRGVFDVVSGRARHRRVINELRQLRHAVEVLHDEQRQLDARIQDRLTES